MIIKIELSDDIYSRYKELAEENGFAVTRLNQIIFERAMKKWMIEESSLSKHYCDACNKEIKTSGAFIDSEERHGLCIDCFQRIWSPKENTKKMR